MSQPVFACYLQVEMQSGTGFSPAEVVELGPLLRHYAFSIQDLLEGASSRNQASGCCQ